MIWHWFLQVTGADHLNGWVYGLWSGFLGVGLLTGVGAGVVELSRRVTRHHREKLAQDARHHAEKLAQDREHHEAHLTLLRHHHQQQIAQATEHHQALKAHITATSKPATKTRSIA